MDRKRILVVEDEAVVGMELQEALERQGYFVPPLVASGADVIPMVLKYKPDLILMDIRLRSFIDGIDAAQRVKIVLDTPIVFLTAFGTDETINRAMKLQPAAYLTKPVREEELFRCIDESLQKRDALAISSSSSLEVNGLKK